jgi:hypothetical protein
VEEIVQSLYMQINIPAQRDSTSLSTNSTDCGIGPTSVWKGINDWSEKKE